MQSKELLLIVGAITSTELSEMEQLPRGTRQLSSQDSLHLLVKSQWGMAQLVELTLMVELFVGAEIPIGKWEITLSLTVFNSRHPR